MKKTVKILTLVFVLLLGTLLFGFGASAANENGILYSVSDGEATVTGVDETVSGDLVIPGELGGYPVTAIGDYAFEDNYEITSLVIPEGVETIGEYSFSYCRYLEKLWFPSTLRYVGKWAFDECFIYELHIPDIATYAQIDYEQVYSHPFCYDDEDGFEWWETEYEKELYIGDSTEPVKTIVIPEDVTRIGNYAFHCNTFLKSVVLPDTLTEIGECAFLDCKNLETVSFGESLEHIGKKAFSACESLGNIALPDSLLTIGEWAFSLNNTMTEVTVPDKVEIIPLGAFSDCKALKTVNLGAGVETICQQAFQNIDATEFVIPDNVKNIERLAFLKCNSLETVVIGDGVTTVGDMPFMECYNLKNVSLGDGLTEISDKFFKIYEHVDDTKDKWIKLERFDTGDGITALPTVVLDRSTLKEIVIGDGITEIADYQFANFDKLEKAILGDNITAIGTEAFYRCTALSELKLPENLETIGNYAFCVCSALPEIVIPEKVVSLGNYAFGACSSAESVTFEGNALRTIGDGAFSDCTALTAITIPEGVTHIGQYLFYWSENLREINLPDSIVSIKSGLIYYTPYDDDYDYDEDMLYIGNHLINGGSYTMPAKYVVRKGTKTIAQYAFSNEHSLETVVIHKGLVSIDDDVFNDCPNLKTIGFTGTEAEWNQILKGNNDFSNYTMEFNYYVCPHENTENKPAVVPGCNTYGYTEGVYCNDCNEWLKGHKQLAMAHKDNDGDAFCDDCLNRVSDITIDERITLPEADFGTVLKFVAPATGEYTIVSFSEGVIDPYVDVYTSDDEWIASNDDYDGDWYNDNYDFGLTCTLEKGKTYIFYITSLCVGEIDVLFTFDCEHEGGIATCSQKALCTKCEMRYGQFNSSNHENIVTLDAVEATCSNTGLTEGKKCTSCGTVTVQQETIQKQTHVYTTTLTKATLSKNGKIETACENCTETKLTTVYYPKTIKLSATEVTYNGKTRSPSLTVKDSKGEALVKGTDYDVTTPSGRKAPGVYEYKITFKGNYEGEKTIKFTILPKAPTSISATQSTSVINLKWSASAGATGYRVYQYSPSKGKYVQIASIKTTSFKKTGLKAGTEYKFKVKPYTKLSDGTVLWGTASDAFTTATECKAPSIKSVSSPSKAKATVKWSNVDGETGYQLYYSTKKTSGFKKVDSYSANKLTGSKTFSSSSSGKTIYFKVRAYQKVNGETIYSEWSAVKSVKLK